MSRNLTRRDFMKVAGAAGLGAVWAVRGFGHEQDDETEAMTAGGFSFVQMSDPHWGFGDASVNPDFAGTLSRAVLQVNSMPLQPDFVVFTGDLTHAADDDGVRRNRMNEFLQIIKDLHAPQIRLLPGENDASRDCGQAYKEVFGQTHYAFDHKNVHFIALDNASDPRARLGDDQLQWLNADLKQLDKEQHIVVLTHRPLFDLAPDWDWATGDGDKAIEMLSYFENVVVLYGHIHQTHKHMTGAIPHYSGMGLMYQLPAPHSTAKKEPVRWDPAQPYKGLGLQDVRMDDVCDVDQVPLVAGMTDPVVKITARKFEFDPKKITLRKDVPVTLELTSLDRLHGFACPDLGIRADIYPGKPNTIKLVPTRAGTFPFHCDIFCGLGHEKMTGTIVVTE
jgi:hypothetical protein